MDPHKLARQNSAIKKALGLLIQSEVKDPRVGFVTVTGVKLNRDQTVAEVSVSIMGDRNEITKSFMGLKKAKGFLQSRLSDKLRMRATPDLRFVVDDSLERGRTVEQILDQMSQEGELDNEAEKRRKMNLLDFKPPQILLDGIISGENFWIVPHSNPDPDAMGSALSLCKALEEIGKSVSVIGYNNPPAGFKSLPGFENIISEDEANAVEPENLPDTVILVDCHRLDRIDSLVDNVSRINNKYCVDHHLISGRNMPLPGWVDPIASSTTMLIMRVIQELGCDLDADMSANIYAGLYADTGGFRYSNTIPASFEAAHELSKFDFDISSIAESLLYKKSKNASLLLSKVLATFSYFNNDTVLLMHVDQEMLSATNTTPVDTEGFISMASSVIGVKYAVFMKELEEGTWRLSLRALDGGDVQSVASNFSGGGHKAAAGCTINGTYEEVEEAILSHLPAE